MSCLHVDSVTKSYDNKKVLTDVFVKCETGEIVALVGRNGSGKSTLLKIIFGVESADFKFVKVDKKVIRTLNDRSNIISYLSQQHFLPKGLKVKSLIKLFLNKEQRNKLLENEILKPILQRTSSQLSGGEKRIVEILLIIHSEAKFILLDEPFNGLSPIAKEYIVNYIKGAKLDKGFIITDHDYENVLRLADRIMFIKEGHLKPVNDATELIALGYLKSI